MSPRVRRKQISVIIASMLFGVLLYVSPAALLEAHAQTTQVTAMARSHLAMPTDVDCQRVPAGKQAPTGNGLPQNLKGGLGGINKGPPYAYVWVCHMTIWCPTLSGGRRILQDKKDIGGWPDTPRGRGDLRQWVDAWRGTNFCPPLKQKRAPALP